MIREIKFRGRNYDGMWMYGYLMPTPKPTIHLDCDYSISVSPSVLKSVDRMLYEVETNTVGQFTGLKDKNGKEIYEGDIIRYTDVESFCVNPDCDLYLQFSQTYAKIKEDVVVFENGMFAVADYDYIRPLHCYGIEDLEDLKSCLGVEDGENEDINGTIIDDSLLGLEVIGNIYDNPELLKEGEK